MIRKLVVYILCAFLFVTPPLSAQRKAKMELTAEKDFSRKGKSKDKKNGRSIAAENWYFKMSGSVSYINMGSEVKQALGQVESLFDGGDVRFELLNFSPEFSMKSDTSVKRATTNFLPTVNTGFGYIMGKHRFEIEFGFAGMVPLNTIDVKTDMTLSEEVCSDLDDCPMAKLGFVDPATGKGEYELDVVMNEEIWLFAPAVSYDYQLTEKPWGKVSVGGSLGLMVLSATQRVKFRFERTDIDESVYGSRVMEGDAMSTTMNDVGPILKIFGSYRVPLWGINTEVRAGVHYGFVNMQRHVDGSGTMYMGGDVLPVSFSTSAMSVDEKGFNDTETTRISMAGIFLQVGILF